MLGAAHLHANPSSEYNIYIKYQGYWVWIGPVFRPRRSGVGGCCSGTQDFHDVRAHCLRNPLGDFHDLFGRAEDRGRGTEHVTDHERDSLLITDLVTEDVHQDAQTDVLLEEHVQARSGSCSHGTIFLGTVRLPCCNNNLSIMPRNALNAMNKRNQETLACNCWHGPIARQPRRYVEIYILNIRNQWEWKAWCSTGTFVPVETVTPR